MIDYFSSFINTNGIVFPGTLAINASGPSATDGTEFIKLMIDDEWGARQALMDYAGLIPDGVTEIPGTAQTIEAIQKGFAAGPGIGVVWWLNDDPSVSGHRVLLLNGQVITIVSFQDLVDATYVGDGNNGTASAFYKTSDAGGTIRDTAGSFFVLPDLRGYALRGLDPAASVDPDGASRDVGSVQIDALQGHWHTSMYASGFTGLGTTGSGWLSNYKPTEALSSINGMVQGSFTDGVSGTPRTDSETRMVNIATRFGITY